MSDHYHTIVWIDHQQAKIFHVGLTEADQATLRSSHPHEHLHHKANSIGSGHARVEHAFLERVSKALSDAGAILITGPASAKDELAAYIKERHPNLTPRISAVEAADHPTDGQLVALARRFFRADDRMHYQSAREAERGSGR